MELERDSDCDYSSLSFRYLENGQDKDEVLLGNNPWSPSSSQELFYFFSNLASENRGGKIVRGGYSVMPSNERGKMDNFRSRSFSGKMEEGSGRVGFGVRDLSLSSASQKVNISSLTSMSAKSRRRMFMFGPVKFKPEMDLVAIKERQRRLSPKRVLPVAGAEEGVVANGGGERAESGGGGQLERVQLIRCRTRYHLSTVLAKPFSCFTVAK